MIVMSGQRSRKFPYFAAKDWSPVCVKLRALTHGNLTCQHIEECRVSESSGGGMPLFLVAAFI